MSVCVSQRSAPTQLFGFQNVAGMGLPSGPGNRTFSLGCVLALRLGAAGLSTCGHVLCCGPEGSRQTLDRGQGPQALRALTPSGVN